MQIKFCVMFVHGAIDTCEKIQKVCSNNSFLSVGKKQWQINSDLDVPPL
jgi:hypothetical protein